MTAQAAENRAPDERTGAAPRRLLFVVTDAHYFLHHRAALAEAAADAGWEVHVATAPGPASPGIAERGFAWHPLPLSRAGLRPDREARALYRTWRLCRRLRPDIVHLVALKPIVLGGLAARVAGVPGRVLAVAGLGHVFTERGLLPALLRAGVRGLLPLLLGRSGRLVVQNADDRARLGRLPSVRQHTVLIPGAGVDLDRFVARREPPPPVRVLLPSRMLWKKGVGEFVGAAERLRAAGADARFLLAGWSDPGNPGAVPESQLRAWHDAGAVEWLGRRDDMPELMAASHIVCLPSYYGEGVPLSLVEAAASGRPAVTTDMPGCRDVVRDGESGLLVPPHDVDALAAALERLIADGELRRRLGARGREIAEAGFGRAEVVAATLAVYRGLAP